MLSERDLAEKLEAFAQNDFRPPEGEDLSKLIPAMLAHIGSTDSHLRDGLIYSAFATWILRDKAMDQASLRGLLPIVLDDQHISYKIGEQNTDSVFTRSFSMLILPLLLITHRSNPLFSPPEIAQIKEQLLDYLDREVDRRGFVDGRGWAHSMAHAADALDDLAQCSELNKSDLVEMMTAIRDVVCIAGEYYAHSEEERLITAVLAVLGRGLLSDEEVTQWITGFADRVLAVDSKPDNYVIRGNVKNFLQSLYFRLAWEHKPNPFAAAINRELQRINPFFSSESG